MKKLVGLFFLSLLALPLCATEKNNDFDVSLANAHYSFKMPNLANPFGGGKMPVEQKGTLNGLNISYTRHNIMSDFFDNENDVFITLQAQYLSGKVDQTNLMLFGVEEYGIPYKVKDVKIHNWDFRLLAGQAYTFGDNLWELAPYMGIAYRYVSSKPGYVAFDDGVNLWLWQQNYHKMKGLYIPLGASFSFKPTDRVKIKLGGEFDAVLKGSYTVSTNGLPLPITVGGVTYDELSNASGNQHGYGFRLNARAEVGYKYMSIFIEPFFNYLKMSRSGEAEIWRHTDTSAIYYIYTKFPASVTKEYGLRLGVAF